MLGDGEDSRKIYGRSEHKDRGPNGPSGLGVSNRPSKPHDPSGLDDPGSLNELGHQIKLGSLDDTEDPHGPSESSCLSTLGITCRTGDPPSLFCPKG